MIRAVIVHPGTQYSFRLAMELYRLGALAGLHTGLAIGEGSHFTKIKSPFLKPAFRRLSNRFVPLLPAGMIHNQLPLELAWHIGELVGLKGEGYIHWRNERCQRAVPEQALVEADVVVGYDTSSWILTERCREIGRPLIVDQTIAHPDAWLPISAELTTQFPDWRVTIEPRIPGLRKAEQIEHDESTLIVASSNFTRKTLISHGVTKDKVQVLPLGVEIDKFTVAPPRGDRPFRFLFVGSISGRKGVPLLLSAWRKLARAGAELWLVGPLSNQTRGLIPDLPGLRVHGNAPHAEIPAIMRQCDVFVFPSYFEGFGLVILEAMATGLPIITTDATAGPDLISIPGEGGWIIPTGEVEALEEAMRHCLAHQREMHAVGEVGRAIASQYDWRAYGQNWRLLLERAVTQRPTAAEPARVN
jgi:alpha-maltose-1-phosphate synthase